MKHAYLIALLVVSGCARAPVEPVIDMKGVDTAQYQSDLTECRGYAEQVDAVGNTAEDTAIGAIGGAAFGAIIGAVFHVPAAGAALGAAAGGFGAGSGGLSASMQRKNIIMDRCLMNRGYKILG
jgi:hypothetical protein